MEKSKLCIYGMGRTHLSSALYLLNINNQILIMRKPQTNLDGCTFYPQTALRLSECQSRQSPGKTEELLQTK